MKGWLTEVWASPGAGRGPCAPESMAVSLTTTLRAKAGAEEIVRENFPVLNLELWKKPPCSSGRQGRMQIPREM